VSTLSKNHVRFLLLCPGENRDGFLTPLGEEQCYLAGQYIYDNLAIELAIAFVSSRPTDIESVVNFLKGYGLAVKTITHKGLAHNSYDNKTEMAMHFSAFRDNWLCQSNRYRGKTILFCSHATKIIAPLLNDICNKPLDNPLAKQLSHKAMVVSLVYDLTVLELIRMEHIYAPD
jgi:hypothetical protein